MKTWKLFKELMELCKVVCLVRKEGMKDKLILMPEKDYLDHMMLLNVRNKEIDLLQTCVEKTIAGGSPCEYCEDLDECKLDCKDKGCSHWWMRYLTEEELALCEVKGE